MEHHPGCAAKACGHCYDCSGVGENPNREREAFREFVLASTDDFDEGGEG